MTTRSIYMPVPYENGQMSTVPIPQMYAQQQQSRARDYLLVILLMIVAGAIGAGAIEYRYLQNNLNPIEPTIVIPPEIHIKAGEPQQIEAITTGKRVIWLSLDPELTLKPAGLKNVWLWASKPGSYRLIAWSAAGDVPTLNASTTVIVESTEKATQK